MLLLGAKHVLVVLKDLSAPRRHSHNLRDNGRKIPVSVSYADSTVVEFATSAVPQQRESITTGREEDHLRTNLCLQRKDCLLSRNPN